MDLLLAFSLQDQVEKYGAYVGLAAFLGLAVLSLLYFAQARELKRLRDWAGRAPERALELQERVVAQAEAALLAPEVEPAVERSGAVGPAQPVQQPAACNGRQAGPIPMGPRPAVALAAAAARAATVTAEPPAEAAEPGTAVAPAGDESGDGARPSDEQAAAPPTGEDRPAEPAEEHAAEEPAAEEAPEEPATSGNGVPAQPPAELPPTSIPRATPRPQPKPAPAAPLQASTTRSATLPPPRRTRRPQRDDGSRTGLYTLIGIVVLAVAIFVPVYFMVLSGDETTPQPNPIAEPGGTPTSDAGAGERAAAARPEKVIVVLNGTAIDGLASGQRDKLIPAGYADGMIRIANSDDQSRQDSIVLYAEDERRQARDVARLLDISRIEAIDDETQALADSTDESGTLPADVVVVVGSDIAP
jgi:LytR cell envelope-related transcriptional attenuator